MQRSKAAHREPHDMRFGLGDMIEQCEDIVGGARLRVGGDVLWYVRRRKAARVEGNRAITLSEIPNLRLKAAQIAGEFMNQDQRMARSGFLEIEAHPVVRCGVRHIPSPGSDGLIACRAARRSI